MLANLYCCVIIVTKAVSTDCTEVLCAFYNLTTKQIVQLELIHYHRSIKRTIVYGIMRHAVAI